MSKTYVKLKTGEFKILAKYDGFEDPNKKDIFNFTPTDSDLLISVGDSEDSHYFLQNVYIKDTHTMEADEVTEIKFVNGSWFVKALDCLSDLPHSVHAFAFDYTYDSYIACAELVIEDNDRFDDVREAINKGII